MMQRTLISLSNLLGETTIPQTSQPTTPPSSATSTTCTGLPKHQTYCDATIDDYEESTHVCHKGYISLFPFMTGLLPPSHPNLPHILNLISNPDELWSPYGIRSLSQTDEFYGTEENYWRSPIWVNMNYLIIRNLYLTATSTDPAAPKKSKSKHARPTSTSGAICARTCIASGRRRASRGSSIIPIPGGASGRSISRVGRVW